MATTKTTTTTKSAAARNGDAKKVPEEIANRPKKKTPEPSDSSSEDGDTIDEMPTTGAELLEQLKNRQNVTNNHHVRPNGIRLPVPPVTLNEDEDESEPDKIAPSQRRDSGAALLSLPVSRMQIRTKKKTTEQPSKDPEAQVNGSTSKAPKVTGHAAYRDGGGDDDDDDDDDYDYTYKTGPLTLKSRHTGDRSRNSSIPNECFRPLTRLISNNDGSDPLGIGSKKETKTYLSSKNFFEYFTGNFYEWGERLDLNGLQGATTFKSGICCTETRVTPPPAHRVTLEFMPALRVHEWPDVADEWRIRARNTIRDTRTNIEYCWPVKSQVDMITKQGCYLLADGAKFRGRSSEGTAFQWQLTFPHAQDTLMTSLSHCHIRCLLWIHLIFRHVLAPVGVLSPHHINTVFFWMVERNYKDWDETTMGERILSFFKELYDFIQRRRLPHYFIRERNLFSSKKPGDLYKAQEKVCRLRERFLQYIMQAAVNLQECHSSYPFPDLPKLWHILTIKSALASLNPSLMPSEIRPAPVVNGAEKDSNNNSRTNNKTAGSEDEGFFGRAKKGGDQTRNLLRQERARRKKEEQENKENAPNSEPEEVIKLEVPIGAMDGARIKLVLKYFIDHFVAVAKVANKQRAYETSIVVLSQASNLATLLQDAGYYEEASQYFEDIDLLRHIAYPSHFNDEVVNIPGTPCVFATGVTAARGAAGRQENIISNWQMKAVPPVPEIVVSPTAKVPNGITKEANKHVHKQNHISDSLNSIAPDLPTQRPWVNGEDRIEELPETPAAKYPSTASKNAKQIRVEAVIEVSSSPLPENSLSESVIFNHANKPDHVNLYRDDDSDGESTDL